MMQELGRTLSVLGLAFAMTGCGAKQTPVLYDNDNYQTAGATQMSQDIEECMQRGQEYKSSGSIDGAEVAGDTATGAAVGAAAGAAGGAIHGNAGRGAASGAAGGAAGGLVHGIFRSFRRSEPDSLYANYVNRCLRDKGYEPIGWK